MPYLLARKGITAWHNLAQRRVSSYSAGIKLILREGTMPHKPQRFRKTELVRGVRPLEDAGHRVEQARVEPDGSLTWIIADPRRPKTTRRRADPWEGAKPE
jgi:hypothetical protein